MLKKISALGLMLAAGVAMTATAGAAPSSSINTMFLQKAIAAGEQEVADAKGQTSSSNASIRYFAHRMIHDHTQADDKLIALAQQENVPMKPAPGPGPAVSGPTYMHMQAGAHETAVALFEKETKDGTGQAKALAEQILPVLKQHLAMAKQFEKQGKITESTAGQPVPQ